MLSFKQYLGEGSAYGLKGWWYNIYNKRVFDISADDGPGDHMGYVWATENDPRLLGITQGHVVALQQAFESGSFDEDAMAAQRALLMNNVRVIFNPKNGEMDLNIGAWDAKWLKRCQDAVVKVGQEGVKKVVIDVHVHDQHFTLDTDDFLAAKSTREVAKASGKV